MSMTPEERRVRNAENRRRYYESNKDKVAKRVALYRESNRDKSVNRDRMYYESNREKRTEQHRRYRRKAGFFKEDGLSFQSWIASLPSTGCSQIFEAIANLQPDPGQTLAQLIHELSGYAMEVCEQIANPPVIEDAPPAQPTPQPDLF